MESEVLFLFLLVSLLSGYVGGLLASYTYQKNQRSRDKRRWEEICSYEEEKPNCKFANDNTKSD